MKISFCTNVKNRLDHIRQTLPFNLGVFDNYRSFVDIEYCVCNYDSEDDLDLFLNKFSRSITVKKVYDKPIYNCSNAKNCAHKMGTGDWLFNLDADNYISAEYFEFIMDAIHDRESAILCHKAEFMVKGFFQDTSYTGASGRIGIRKDLFYKCGGYDEQLEGWGNDDADIIFRASELSDLNCTIIPEYLLAHQPSVIIHGDDLRTMFHKEKNKLETNRVNIDVAQENYKNELYVANKGKTWGV